MPAGTIKVDVSDTQDWYQLGQDISNLEKMNQGFIVLTVKTKKSQTIENQLKNIEGVQEVEMLTPQHYRIKMAEQEDIIEKIASEVIRTGSGLVELSPSRANLEDVFLKLTYGQTKAEA
jgi:ABC-2 type transport system ATP-binding protein